MTDTQWDKLLRIRTTGRDDSHSDQYRFPYEPTPYSVLERLAESGYLKRSNTLLDYGCGKGRVSFFLAYQVGCRCVGVEADERIYAAGLENLETAVSAGKVKPGKHGNAEFAGEVKPGKHGNAESTGKVRPENPGNAVFTEKVKLEHIAAENYAVPETIDRCFFFNPFSEELLQKVLARILESWYETPRELLLFFYYPSDEYISCLMTVPELMFSDEIDCRDLFPKEDQRERVVVFEVTGKG